MIEESTQIGEVSSAWADLGPAQPSSYAKPQQQPSGKTLRVVSDLGLRYPPRAAVDEADHAARVLLLAKDCADINPDWLEAAADDWAKRSPFFPRACELREQAMAIGRINRSDRILSAPAPRPEPKPPAPPLSDEEIRKLPRHLIELGVSVGDIDPKFLTPEVD